MRPPVLNVFLFSWFPFFSGNLFFLGNLKFKPGHTTKPKNQRILSNVWAKIFFTGIVLYVVFGFPRVFLVFGSGSFYRLLGPPKTKKPWGKPKKTKDSQECLGQGLCSEALFFLFSSSFFGFLIRKLLSATRTTNNLKTSRKTKKTENNTVFSGMSGPLSSDAVVFYLFFLFFFVLWFACFCFWVMVAAPPRKQTYSPGKPITHEFVFNNWVFALFNASCSCSKKNPQIKVMRDKVWRIFFLFFSRLCLVPLTH